MNYIFSTGLPRSGSALLTKSLYVSNRISMPVGPNLEIYRFLRDKIISKYGSISLKKKVKKYSPFQDYYGSKEGAELLRLMLGCSLKEKFDKKDWNIFLKKSQSRRDHDSPDLIKHFLNLKGETFKDIVLNLLNIIKKNRKLKNKTKTKEKKYYGFHETWNICSLKSLASAFPKAKFYVLIRDPRSVYASLLKNGEKKKELRVQLLSFVRHFRKYIMLADYYLSLPIFKNRLMIIKYEDLVTNPKNYLKKICKFSNIGYNKNMINPNKYYDFSTKKTWIPFSSFNTKFPKLNNKPMHKWKKYLSDIEVKSIELLCEQEMKSISYNLKFDNNKNSFNEVMKFIKKDYNKKAGWRSDLRNFEQDKSVELIRHKILKQIVQANEPVLKKCFLFNNYSLSNLIKHYENQ
jgi:hypothetical protein